MDEAREVTRQAHEPRRWLRDRAGRNRHIDDGFEHTDAVHRSIDLTGCARIDGTARGLPHCVCTKKEKRKRQVYRASPAAVSWKSVFDERWTMFDGRWTMGDGRWAMGDGRWAMGDGRWTMDDGRWTASGGRLRGRVGVKTAVGG